MMIAVPVAAPLRKNDGNEGSRKEEMESFFNGGVDDFSDFTAGDLLDAIDFDDLLLGINDEYVLPHLELDQQDLLSEFSTSGGEEYSDAAKLVEKFQEEDAQTTKDDDDKLSGSGSDLVSSRVGEAGDEIVNKAGKKEGHHDKRKRSSPSSAQDKNNNALKGKKKVKVDWTPELHKRFVQAVEQLGVDKAVPSRILEIMGIDCLTRHNIASHLQKYRSHRKHLLAREAEAANWTQRRQIYSPATAGGGGKMNINPWLAPTIGFPQMAPPTVQHNVRPFHVWGHPPVEQSPAHMWPKHLSPPLIAPPRPTMWAHPPPHTPPHIDSSYWYPPPGHHTVPGGFTQGTPCFQAPLATARFPAPHVPAVPTHPMYKAEPRMSVPAERSGSHSPLDLHPSSESIDAAIGDVLSKSWLPLPIGLKPPSLDSVMGELERQGVPKVPPTCAASDSGSIS